jgi:hypothetical protein
VKLRLEPTCSDVGVGFGSSRLPARYLAFHPYAPDPAPALAEQEIRGFVQIMARIEV